VPILLQKSLRYAANRDSVLLARIWWGQAMMGRLKSEQAQLFYQFDLNDAVPEVHLVRKIDGALDLSWSGDWLVFRAIFFKISRPRPKSSEFVAVLQKSNASQDSGRI
jgi:hypothetical protein